MKTPKKFKVIYTAECGDQIEMISCLVPSVRIPCEDCNTTHKYIPDKLVHQSFDWDRLEFGLNEIAE